MGKELNSRIFGGLIGAGVGSLVLKFGYESTRDIYYYLEYHQQEITEIAGNSGYLISQLGGPAICLTSTLLLGYFAVSGSAERAARFYRDFRVKKKKNNSL